MSAIARALCCFVLLGSLVGCSGGTSGGGGGEGGGAGGGVGDNGLADAGVPDAGASDAGPADAGAIDAGDPLILSSSALTDGGAVPVRYTCTDTTTNGHVSPPFGWTADSSAASFALVMTDTSINLIHWVIWDIPSAALALPEGVENAALPMMPSGAKQTKSYDGATYGYLGPCPPSTHVYRFELFALDAGSLPSVTTASTRTQLKAAIDAHSSASAAVLVSYGP
jgi:Raf kinase inhibitor-like YbhB/YbcL family protein